MGTIEEEDVIGVMIGGKVICKDCVEDEDWNAAKETDFLTKTQFADTEDLVFCDACREKLHP